MKPTKKVRVVPLDSIKPAPENNDIYSAIAWNNPDLQELAKSIKEHGVLDPLTISRAGTLLADTGGGWPVTSPV
jgi:ParB-like chromosome segregation protein Spo0J